MSEVDDRDFALAEKSLASLRDHWRAGAAAHPDNSRLEVSLEIGRILLHTGRASPLSPSLSSFLLFPQRSRSNSSSTFSLSFSLFFSRRIRHSESDGKKIIHFATRSPGIGARYGRLTGISKRRSYYHCTPILRSPFHVREIKCGGRECDECYCLFCNM